MKPLPPLACGSCHACCEPPFLDDNEDSPHKEGRRFWNGMVKNWQHRFAARPDGKCAFLDDTKGCTIYDSRPNVCRRFDCRTWYLTTPRHRRRALAASGEIPQAVWDAAKERLP